MACFILGDDLPSNLVQVKVHPYTALLELFQHHPIESQSDTGAITQDMHTSNMQDSPDVSVEPALADDAFASASDLGKFLERKTKLFNGTWVVGSPLNISFNPWEEFVSNPIIIDKIKNYKLIKGELVLTFYVNGTSFHAGMILASYRYMRNSFDPAGFTFDERLITRSQRPKIFLNASTNKSGILRLPFAFPENYVTVFPALNAIEVGACNIDSFSNLTMLNGGTDPVTLSVFAHMEKVILAAPTIQPQSDEFEEKGPISKIASSVANLAGDLAQKFPSISKFALASQMGASTIGKIASLFGFSKPTNIENHIFVHPSPVGNLALCEGRDNSQKLTVTAKQELTIDPTTCGFPEDDMLALIPFCERESYIAQFSWSASAPSDSILYYVRVNPCIERKNPLAILGGFEIIPTPMSFVSRLFENWCGSIRYRFQIVGTQFHRGRLAFCFEPSDVDIANPDPYNANYTTIIDISETRDFTIEVPWQQALAYKGTDVFSTVFSSTSRLTSLSSTDNGILFVRVINELVTPDSTLPITILMSVSAGDNFELVNPTHRGVKNYSFKNLIAQSGEFRSDIESQAAGEVIPAQENCPGRNPNPINIVPNYISTDISAKPLLYYGEKVLSIRQLLKRSTFYRTMHGVAGAFTANYFSLSAFPKFMGFDDLDGIDVTASGTGYNYVGFTYLAYFKRCFAGWRGGIRWKFAGIDGQVTNMVVSRRSDNSDRVRTVDYRVSGTNDLNNVNQSALNEVQMINNYGSLGGSALTVNRTNDSLEVEIPFTFPIRFATNGGNITSDTNNTSTAYYPNGDSFDIRIVNSNNTATKGIIDLFVSAGDDFTFMGFIGCPVFYTGPIPLA